MALDRTSKKRVGNTRGWPFDGFLFLLYIALFCVERFGMEWLRGDRIPLLGPLSWVHLATLAGLAAAIAIIAWRVRGNVGAQPADSPSRTMSQRETTGA
jgi:prolipoprotein diacylglyceryltransferase